MKKIIALLCALCAACAFVAFSACKDDKPQQVNLNFDRQEAYFTSSTPLYPIAGTIPSQGDTVERADVVISSDIAVRMVLSLEYDEGQADLPGLMISVNGTAAMDMEDGMILYTSPEAETQTTVSLAIYLANGSPSSNKGKTLGFSLALSALEQ